jgi:hypothetical protein
VEGGISDENKKPLSSSNLQLTFEASSGGLYQGNKRRPAILTNLEDIIQMLENMKQRSFSKYAGSTLVALIDNGGLYMRNDLMSCLAA